MKEAIVSATTLEQPRYNHSSNPRIFHCAFNGCATIIFRRPAQVEQRVHLLDDRHAVGFSVPGASFYIVPETYAFFQTFRSAFSQTAKKVALDPNFWTWEPARAQGLV